MVVHDPEVDAGNNLIINNPYNMESRHENSLLDDVIHVTSGKLLKSTLIKRIKD